MFVNYQFSYCVLCDVMGCGMIELMVEKRVQRGLLAEFVHHHMNCLDLHRNHCHLSGQQPPRSQIRFAWAHMTCFQHPASLVFPGVLKNDFSFFPFDEFSTDVMDA